MHAMAASRLNIGEPLSIRMGLPDEVPAPDVLPLVLVEPLSLLPLPLPVLLPEPAPFPLLLEPHATMRVHAADTPKRIVIFFILRKPSANSRSHSREACMRASLLGISK